MSGMISFVPHLIFVYGQDNNIGDNNAVIVLVHTLYKLVCIVVSLYYPFLHNNKQVKQCHNVITTRIWKEKIDILLTVYNPIYVSTQR